MYLRGRQELLRTTQALRRPTISKLIRAGILLVTFIVFITPTLVADVTGEQVKRAIRRGVEALQRRQAANGSWPERYQSGGESCLATFALLTAGESPTSDNVARALEHIQHLPNQTVYVTAAKLLALAKADPKRYHVEISDAAKWLIAAQNETGLWTYTPGGARYDNSNSQFAILALNAAEESGVEIPTGVWRRAQETVVKTQNRDGGWAYQQQGQPSYGSMTAAGVANLLIFGNAMEIGREAKFRNGVAPGCGEYRAFRPLADGMKWLARKFEIVQNPGMGRNHLFYWMYAAERVGVLSGQRYFGNRDWYLEGARQLVKLQQANGFWSNSDLVDTCFAVMFLAKGHKPLFVQKLKWSDDDSWNPDRYDVEHLVAFVGDKLGEPGAWQVVPFDAPLEDWLASPIVYVQGHRFPKWTEPQRAKVRRYVELGGTILFEACCGRPDFRSGCEAFLNQAFPEAPLRELSTDHGVYSAQFTVASSGLKGIDLGCRTSVFYSPNDLSCLWEQADVPQLSEQALQLGTNLIAYAAGRQPLRDRLDIVTVPKELEAEIAPKSTGDALQLAQIVYTGDWRPDPLVLVKTAELIRDQFGVDVVTRYRTPRLTGDELARTPILYLTGHFDVPLRADELAALSAHLHRGGFLFAESCCGRTGFDQSFRRLMGDVLPGVAAVRIPSDHPLLRGQPGFPIERVVYKEAIRQESPDRSDIELWSWTIEGRLAVVYSPYSLGCAVDGHACYNCRGIEGQDAKRVMANIFLYAMTH